MSPYGPSLLKKGSRFSCSRANMVMGRVKTKVLPEPVKAMPIMSRPDRLQTTTVNSWTIYMHITFITYFIVCLLPLHCRDSLYLNWCGMHNALLFQTFKNCCKNKKPRSQLLMTSTKGLLHKDKVFVFLCVQEEVCCNLVETSSPWSFWLEQGCHRHQPGCETSSWRARVGWLAYSGCSVVASSCK